MSHCSDFTTCPEGNCIGCKNGKLWCHDPRCSPYCRECAIPPDHDFNGTVVVIIIILCLSCILIIIWFAYGPKIVKYQ